MLKNYPLLFGATLLALLATPVLNAREWTNPGDLDGQKMALQYRVDNWEMFTNVHVDPVEFEMGNSDAANSKTTPYVMYGMMSWYPSQFVLKGGIELRFDPEKQVISIPSMQPLMEREGIVWSIYNLTEDESIDDYPVCLRRDKTSPHNDWVLINNRTEDNGVSYYSGGMMLASEMDPGADADPDEEIVVNVLYMFKELSLHPYNGLMEYDFVDMQGRDHHNSSVVHTWVDGKNLFVRNWSNVGFDYDVFFSIDPEAGTVTATGQVLLDDPDMLGECLLGTSNVDGTAGRGPGQRHSLTGTFKNIEEDGITQTVIEFPTWGAYNERDVNFFNPTNNTVLYVGYDILDPNASVGQLTQDETAAPIYYNLQGVRIDSPVKGEICIERRGAESRKFIAR